MRMIEYKQVKAIYAMANKIGISEKGNKNDDLHNLVLSRFKKTSIKDLTYFEAESLKRELNKHLKPVKNNSDGVPGMMTAAQKKKVWALIYKLCEIDEGKAKPNERLAGAVNKILGLSKTESNPLAWVKFEDGNKLIEYLKRYVKSAEKKRGEA